MVKEADVKASASLLTDYNKVIRIQNGVKHMIFRRPYALISDIVRMSGSMDLGAHTQTVTSERVNLQSGKLAERPTVKASEHSPVANSNRISSLGCLAFFFCAIMSHSNWLFVQLNKP